MAKVSVVIPTYNRAQYIERAINSVLNQTYKDFEIIIIDDGSTDNTREVLAKYDGRIVYEHQNNRGISASRNRGIKLARGEYIAFLDSDDEWVPEKLDIQVKMLDKNNKLGLVCSRMIILDEHNQENGYKPQEKTGRNFKELLEIFGDLPTSTVVTRKECFDKVGVFDEKLPPMEDFEMWVRIASKYDIYMLPDKVLAKYYQHDDQITKDMTLVYEATIKLDKKFTSLFSHLADFPGKVISKRISANEYVLSRIYYRKRQYSEAFRMLCASVFGCPMVGAEFIKKRESFMLKAVKFIKPYGFFAVCFSRWLISGCFLRTTSSKEAANRCPLKILFIHGHHDNIAGQELSLLDRMQGLRGLGIQSAVLLSDEGIFADRLRKNGFEVKYFPLNRLSRRNPFRFFKTVFGIRRIIIDGQFSVIHSSGAYPNQYSLPAARLCGRPCIVHINTTVYSKRDLNVNFVRHADFIFTVSDAVRQKVTQTIKITSDKIMTIYCGVKDSGKHDYSAERLTLREQFNILPGQKVLGQISSIIPRKGLENFIRMARFVKDEYPDVKFLIVGRSYNNEYQSYLIRLIGELRLQEDIMFADFQEDVYRFIDLIDINVLASEAEGLARVIVEVQMAGKPIIATDVSGNAEAIIHQKTGLLVPPDDPRALADAALGLLKDANKSKILGENAKQTALEQFQIKRHAKILKDVYQGLLK